MSANLPLEVKIAGVSFNNDDGSSRQEYVQHLLKGDKLKLVDAASDEYPEAIAVYTQYNKQIGFLPSYTAKQLRSEYSNFRALCCLVMYVGRASDSLPYGVNVSIGDSRDSALSLFSNSDRQLLGGSSYSHPSTPSPVSYNSYNSRQQQKSSTPWGCLVPSIIGLIIGIVLAKVFR